MSPKHESAPTSAPAKKPRSIKNKPRFDDAGEAYKFLQQRRPREDIDALVAAVQTGSAVAQAFGALATMKSVALAVKTPPSSPTTYIPGQPADERLLAMVESAAAITGMMTVMRALSTQAAVAAADALLRRSHLTLPAKRLASLTSEAMVMAVFAVCTAARQTHTRVEPAEMDALVQIAGVREPTREFAADPRRRRQRTLVWKITLDRARALATALPKT
jgi:hypothetical protein